MPVHADLPLHELVYGDGRQRLVETMLAAESTEVMLENCSRICRGVHELYQAMRSMRQVNRKNDSHKRLHFYLSALNMTIAVIMADMVGLMALQLQIACDHRMRNLDAGTIAHDMRYASMLLECCMDTIDKMLQQQPSNVRAVCAAEGVPLHAAHKQEHTRVNRFLLHWGYCQSPKSATTDADYFKVKVPTNKNALLAPAPSESVTTTLAAPLAPLSKSPFVLAQDHS